MIYSKETIDPDLLKVVKKDFNKSNSVLHIANKYSLTYNEVLCLLNEAGIKPDRLKKLLCEYDLGSEPFIIISDTHLGSALENIKYLDRIYEYATINNIKTILHTGDLFQSTLRPVDKSYTAPFKQVEHVVKDYPKDDNIRNYILFGNHDFHLLRRDDELYQVVSSRSDFNILGFKKAYFLWNKFLFSANHEIEHYKLQLPNVDSYLRFVGHRHELKVVGDKTIMVPTLSEDIKRYDKYNYPGFLVVKKENNRLRVFHYIIKDFTDIPEENYGTPIPIFPHGAILSKSLLKRNISKRKRK